MNIIQLEDNLKSLPDSNLQNEMTNPTGMFPQYLVMSEIQRREEMRKDYEGRMAANEKTPPLPSMREQMMAGITQPQPPVQDSGIAGLLPAQPQGAPIPPAMSAGPDVMPMYGGGVVGMNVGMEVPNIYDKEYEDYLKKLALLEEKEESLYEQLMAEQPERIEEERKFGQGMALLRAGIAVGTSATPKDLGKNLEATINSLDATNKSISAKKDKLTELELKKSSLDVKRLGDTLDKRTNILSKKDTAESMKDMYKSTAVKTAEYLQSSEGQDLKLNNPTLYQSVMDSLNKSSAGSDWFTRAKANQGLKILDEYQGPNMSVLLDNEIRKLYDDPDMVIDSKIREKYLNDKVQKEIESQISILINAIPELSSMVAPTELQYSGGVVGKSVQDFNDIVKILNG